MVRAAAKNFQDVVVVSDPNDYQELIDEWDDDNGISYESRKRLSQKVFSIMADYNKSISLYFDSKLDSMVSRFIDELPEVNLEKNKISSNLLINSGLNCFFKFLSIIVCTRSLYWSSWLDVWKPTPAPLSPKPVEGDWNGSGMHVNFSTEESREKGGEKLFTDICESLGFFPPRTYRGIWRKQ